MINLFHHLQAEAFIDWQNRLPEEHDLASTLEFWLDSKDFAPKDRLAIRELITNLLQAVPAEGITTASGVR